jgi:phosphatidylglycerol:prolipoprotein diacylglycerol transferase
MFPTLLQVGGFRLATYGVLVASGYLLGIWWLARNRARMKLDEEAFWSLVYWLFAGALIGGKLLYLGVEWKALASGALHPVRDLRYGFVFFGGVTGSMAAGVLWCRRNAASFARLSDFFAVALPMGHALGRLGCLAAGCCAGRPTGMPWGIRFTDPDSLVNPLLAGVPLHPFPLYESAANAAAAWACSRVLLRVEAGTVRAGSGWAAYLGLYGFARFFLETFRGDDRGQGVLGLSPSQAVGALAMAGAAWWWATRRKP